MDSSGIRIRRVPKAEERFMTEVDYPLERAQEKFRGAVDRFNQGHINNNLKEALNYED